VGGERTRLCGSEEHDVMEKEGDKENPNKKEKSVNNSENGKKGMVRGKGWVPRLASGGEGGVWEKKERVNGEAMNVGGGVTDAQQLRKDGISRRGAKKQSYN